MKLSIHLVTWNGGKYIPDLFDSLRKQTYQDYKLVILDNASTDDTVEKIRNELVDFNIEHELIINKENKGFAGGHNQLWTSDYGLQTMDYVLLLNQDMYLMPDCIEKLMSFISEHREVAAVSPRLMKWDFANKKMTDKIDTLGLKVLRNRRVIEKYTGKDWNEIKPKMLMSFRTEKIEGDGVAIEVFGVSGALPLLRTRAINNVGLFDEDYNSYKEDVDLAYRLRIAGYKAYTLLDAVAYHDRSAAGVKRKGNWAMFKNKQKQTPWVKYFSYKNHLITLIKNEYWQNFLLDLPWIKWYELKKFIYFLLFDRKVLKGLGEIVKTRKELRTKRNYVKNLRKISWQELRKWWK